MGRKVSAEYTLAKLFSQPIAKTALGITIEVSDYPSRPYVLIIWTEYDNGLKPLHKIFMTNEDVVNLYQRIKSTYEDMNNGK